MFAKLKLGKMRRRLRRSLGADEHQRIGWEDWLERAGSVDELREAADPGWLMHVAFWSDLPRPRLYAAALEVAQWLHEQAGVELPIRPAEWKELRTAAEVGVDEFLGTDELITGIGALESSLESAPSDAESPSEAAALDEELDRALIEELEQELEAQAASEVEGEHEPSAVPPELADDVDAETLVDELLAPRAGSEDIRAATLFLMFGALHCLAGREEALGEALGMSMALLSTELSTQRIELTKRLRAGLGW